MQLTESQVNGLVSNNGFLTNFTEAEGSTTNLYLVGGASTIVNIPYLNFVKIIIGQVVLYYLCFDGANVSSGQLKRTLTYPINSL